MSKSFIQILNGFDLFLPGRKVAWDYVKSANILGDIYIYGVWSGVSTRETLLYFDKNNIPYNKAWGFDSFEGLPEETLGMKRCDSFFKGAYSSTALYNESNPIKVVEIISKAINNPNLKLIPGYFSDILSKDLVEKVGLKPASFIEVDVALYGSTIDLLEFMLSNKLIQNGTVVYFDDWAGNAKEEFVRGESLVWKQMVKKYNIKFKEIYSTPKTNGQKVFVINSNLEVI